jgi:hypothetical protein
MRQPSNIFFCVGVILISQKVFSSWFNQPVSRVLFQRFENLMAIAMLRLIVTDRDRDFNPNPENRTENSQI